MGILKVRKRAKIRKRYNQVPYLTQDTNGKEANSQLDITNESQEVSPFPAGEHKVTINRRSRKHNRNNMNDPQNQMAFPIRYILLCHTCEVFII